ncbi:MAG: choice-of-anchor P family protein [Acidimicrobiales bacterium]
MAELAVGLTGAAAQSPATSSGYGVRVDVTLLGAPPITVGPLARADSAGPTSATVLSATVPGVLTTGALSTSASASGGNDMASASVAGVSLPLLSALGGVAADNVQATCSSSASGEKGSTTLTNATLGSLGALAVNPANNTVIKININGQEVATLTLNEQVLNGDGSLTVNAFHLHLDGGVAGSLGTGDVILGSVTCGAGLAPSPPSLSESFSPNSIAVNGTSTLSFTVTNPNASTTLTGVGFTDTLPTGLVVSTPNAQTGSCGGGTISDTAGGTSISLTGASLAAAATCTFSVR